MKNLYPLTVDVSARLVEYISTQQSAFNGEGLEAKDLGLDFTLNNVAICAFGLEGKCFEDPNSEFKLIAHRFIAPDGWANFKLHLVNALPFLQDYVSIKWVCFLNNIAVT